MNEIIVRKLEIALDKKTFIPRNKNLTNENKFLWK